MTLFEKAQACIEGFFPSSATQDPALHRLEKTLTPEEAAPLLANLHDIVAHYPFFVDASENFPEAVPIEQKLYANEEFSEWASVITRKKGPDADFAFTDSVQKTGLRLAYEEGVLSYCLTEDRNYGVPIFRGAFKRRDSAPIL